MTPWLALDLFLVTFAGGAAAGLVVVYHRTLAGWGLRCFRFSFLVATWPVRKAWGRLQSALSGSLASRVGDVEQRLDSLESILRSIRDRLPAPGTTKRKSETSDNAQKEPPTDE